jgi:hypothetical protein
MKQLIFAWLVSCASISGGRAEDMPTPNDSKLPYALQKKNPEAETILISELAHEGFPSELIIHRTRVLHPFGVIREENTDIMNADAYAEVDILFAIELPESVLVLSCFKHEKSGTNRFLLRPARFVETPLQKGPKSLDFGHPVVGIEVSLAIAKDLFAAKLPLPSKRIAAIITQSGWRTKPDSVTRDSEASESRFYDYKPPLVEQWAQITAPPPKGKKRP